MFPLGDDSNDLRLIDQLGECAGGKHSRRLHFNCCLPPRDEACHETRLLLIALPHSPFPIPHSQIASATSWTDHFINWRSPNENVAAISSQS